MRLTALFVMLMAVLALFAGAGDAAPQPGKGNWKGLVKVGSKIKKVIGALGAAATAHQMYSDFKGKQQQPQQQG